LPHLATRDGEAGPALVGFDDASVSTRVRELADRRARADGPRTHTLVLVDGTAAMRGSTGLAAITAPAGGDVSVIWCARDIGGLPSDATAIAALSTTPRAGLQLTRSGQRDSSEVRPDLLSIDVATEIARRLAPLRDSASADAAGLPSAVRWEQVADVDLRDHGSAVRALTRHWSRGPSTTITLGRCRDEPVTVDLCRDGPHALIAGTTGSGKSELLLSLVASLAAVNRPDQLSLLLIDHKGGAAFGPCARLPHTVGVVTDLDAESTKRALLSLTAELRRREALFAAAAATDLESYLTTAAEPLARLVIVVDEFATLAEEQPEFVGGLVGIAQRGRSLGVHLVLATQRPDGVVSADIRANTRLRICLGVARENESRDVIDCADAVTISRTTPGRGYLRIGPGELREFQTARVGGRRADVSGLSVTLSPAALLGAPPPPALAPADAPPAGADLDLLIAAALEVSVALGVSTPPPPWLPPLPDQLALSTLPSHPDPGVVTWGLLDLPAAGQQRELTVDLGIGGATLIAGTARSGRTTAARTIVLAAAARRSPAEFQVWAIDSGAGLADLDELAHCGGILPAHDLDRTERLLSYLTDEVGRRRLDPTDDRPALMLVIDSWEGLATANNDRDASRMVDRLLRLAADGPAAGLHLIITTDRAGLVGRVGAVTSDKIVLRLADPGDYALVGMPARDVPRRLSPGRGVRAADLALLQVALADDAATVAARGWPRGLPAVPRFDPLPRFVAFTDLRQPAPAPAPADQIALGLNADDLSTLAITRAEIGTSFVILGPHGSGRSTALALLARQRGGRRLAISCLPRSPLLARLDAIHLPRDDQDHALAMLDSLCAGGDAPPDLLIDDIDQLGEGPLWGRLEDLMRRPASGDQILALSGSTEEIAAAFRGPLAAARRAKTGLLLCPSSPHDGEALGIRLPRHLTPGDPPGRGWLAIRGIATRVQLADPGQPAPVSTTDLAPLVA
jgi:DNA segregation ATPase FtsK/SpoIIIE, S-DNA-T family